MKKTVLFAALATVLVASPAFAAETSSNSQSTVDPKDNGGYVATDKMENTTSDGTTIKHETTKKLTVDNNGNREKAVTIKTSTDPKGLMNKSTTEVKNKETVKDGKVETSHKKTIDGKTVEQSDDTQQQ